METVIIENFDQIPPNLRCCLYGSGQTGKIILEGLKLERPDILVNFLVDSFNAGNKFGLDIVTPDCLINERKDDYDFIFITSGYVDQILEIIDSLNLKNKDIFIAGRKLWGDNYIKTFYKHSHTDPYFFNNFVLEFCSTKCNMGCKFCERNEEPAMDYELFIQLIDEIAENRLAKTVNLVGIGEPLIDNRLIDAIKYCKSKGLNTITFTNGLVLDTKLYQNLLDSGLDRLYISLHNLSENTFEYRNAYKKFNQYYSDILKCIDYNVSNNISSELVIRLLYDMSENFSASESWEMPEMVKDTKNAMILFQPFLKDLQNIAEKNNIKFHLSSERFENALNLLKETQSGQFIHAMANITLNLAFLIGKPLLEEEEQSRYKIVKTKVGTCFAVNTPSIASDGTFKVACCGKYPLKIGKVSKDTPIMEILNSKIYNKVIKGFQNNQLIMPECQKCKGQIK